MAIALHVVQHNNCVRGGGHERDEERRADDEPDLGAATAQMGT